MFSGVIELRNTADRNPQNSTGNCQIPPADISSWPRREEEPGVTPAHTKPSVRRLEKGRTKLKQRKIPLCGRPGTKQLFVPASAVLWDLQVF